MDVCHVKIVVYSLPCVKDDVAIGWNCSPANKLSAAAFVYLCRRAFLHGERCEAKGLPVGNLGRRKQRL